MKRSAVLLLLLLITSGPAYALTGRRIIEMTDSLPKAETSRSQVVMTIYKGGKEVEKKFRMEMITLDPSERRSLISFERPSSMKLLTHSVKGIRDYQWLAMSSGKVKRITDAAKRKSFAGSHFAYEDLSSQNIDDYDYILTGEDSVEGVVCYRVECLPVTGDGKKISGYSKTVVYPRKKDGFIMKIDFYEEGRHKKTMVNKEVKMISGVLTPVKITMYDSLSDDRTVLVSVAAENNIEIPRSGFNREAIKFNE